MRVNLGSGDRTASDEDIARARAQIEDKLSYMSWEFNWTAIVSALAEVVKEYAKSGPIETREWVIGNLCDFLDAPEPQKK